ncbi:MAG: hypothetical protein ACM3MG_02660 [Bacillota bacterium]
MAWFKNLRELIGAPKKENGLCMVVSEQEGAEIWVNGQKTKLVTPSLIALVKDTEIEIEVCLTGHEPHKAWVRSSNTLSYYYCNLKRIPLRLVPNEISHSSSFKKNFAPNNPSSGTL